MVLGNETMNAKDAESEKLDFMSESKATSAASFRGWIATGRRLPASLGRSCASTTKLHNLCLPRKDEWHSLFGCEAL
jgi:hypothetical protein